MLHVRISALRHIAYHLATLATVAILVRLGYRDKQHAVLAAVCATGLASSLLFGLTAVRAALRWRANRRPWSASDWLGGAMMTTILASIATLCIVGLLAASRWEEGPPAWAAVVIRTALAVLTVSLALVFIVIERAWRLHVAAPSTNTLRCKYSRED